LPMSGMRGAVEQFATRLWYGRSLLRYPLWPLSLLYRVITSLRRWLYRHGIFASYSAGAPVVVIGNVTVGGTGKTPVTLWLAGQMRTAGLEPAIVARGYGAPGVDRALRVSAESDPLLVGDEPVLLARRSGCPVYVDRNRVRAARAAVANGADVVICDDGLQHYRLRRDVEIAVVDGSRRFGNGIMLPAGPLREPAQRLAQVDRVMVQLPDGVDEFSGQGWLEPAGRVTNFSLQGDTLRAVSGDAERALSSLSGRSVHAIAGIGNPQRFFAQLERAGLHVAGRALPDHARIVQSDIDLEGEVIMTEKDAVKCRRFADQRHWYLPVELRVAPGDSGNWLKDMLARIAAGQGGAA